MNPQEPLILFDTYRFTVPEGLKVQTEDITGNRALFLTDPEESFTITFGENMELMDMLPLADKIPSHSYQCCRKGKYIHLRRTITPTGTCGFFHMELEDAEGRTLSLPGQITATSAYPLQESIDPILLEILDGLTLL